MIKYQLPCPVKKKVRNDLTYCWLFSKFYQVYSKIYWLWSKFSYDDKVILVLLKVIYHFIKIYIMINKI